MTKRARGIIEEEKAKRSIKHIEIALKHLEMAQRIKGHLLIEQAIKDLKGAKQDLEYFGWVKREKWR